MAASAWIGLAIAWLLVAASAVALGRRYPGAGKASRERAATEKIANVIGGTSLVVGIVLVVTRQPLAALAYLFLAALLLSWIGGIVVALVSTRARSES